MDNSQKRIPKTSIKFSITLSDEQKLAKAEILRKPFNFVLGKAGSGKTLLACQIALDKYFKREVELVSLTHFRGRTFNNAVCIVDEFQNLTRQQFQMVISRLGKGSTMIFCGDTKQCDLKNKNDSAINEIPKITKSQFVFDVKLKDNHRHEALDEILDLLNDT